MSTRVTRSARGLSNGVTVATKKPSPVGKDSAKKPKKGGKKRAAQAEDDRPLKEKLDSESMPPPATPPAKRARKVTKQASAIPPTPTPAEAKELNQPASPATKGNIPLDRPADPEASNAPLSTPRGSRHVAYSKDEPPPDYLPKPRTDTANLLKNACDHLCKVDPRMKLLIEKHPCSLFTPEALAQPVDPFKSLVSGILGQQVSGAAAASIRKKFVALFNVSIEDETSHKFPTPKQVTEFDLPTLRTAGLSQRKAEYISGLAEKFVNKELSAEMLAKASWEEVLEKLTAVRGLGVWSVEMFGCFALKRMDIFSTGDLGVQRGLAAFMGRDIKKLRAKGGGKWKYMSEEDMIKHSAKFAPYRTLFMWYMWRVEDVQLDVLTD